MPRPSRQTDRVVTIIDLLTRSDEPLTMTEIAHAAGVDQATTVHVLAVLETAGYVVRSPETRRYDVGPALVRPGATAQASDPTLAIARAVMDDLTADLDLPCFCFAREGDHARLVQYTWPRGAAVPGIRVGEAFPLVPPLGVMFFAWGDDAAYDAWLSTAEMTAERARRYHDQRAAIVRDGFIVEIQPSTAEPELVAAIDDRPSPYRDKRLHRMLDDHVGGDHNLTEISDADRYRIHDVGAPVFGPEGEVVMSLNVIGFDEDVTGAEIIRIGAAVQVAADLATRAIAG